MNKMPIQKPGKSEQVVCTPPEFLNAVKKRLGIDDFSFDLAASEENTVASAYYTEEDNALIQVWHGAYGWLWLNPPYENLMLWTTKAQSEAKKGAKIAMLVPASTGSNWWALNVHDKAYITFLNGRITFVGHTSPYPKDLALLLYTPYLQGGSCVWKWK